MPCHRSGYDRHKIRTPATQIHYIPLKQGVLKTLFAKPAGTPVIWIKPLLEMSVLESKNSSDRYKYVRDTKATRYPGGLFGLVFQPPRPAPPSDYRTYNTQDKHLRRISQQQLIFSSATPDPLRLKFPINNRFSLLQWAACKRQEMRLCPEKF